MNTINLPLRTVGSLVTVADWNALFAAIQVVINQKVKLTNGVLEPTCVLTFANDGGILNVQSTETGDLLGYTDGV